jgi:hypothetical protein
MKAGILTDGWGMDILLEVARRKLRTRVSIMTAYFSTETAQDNFRLNLSITSLIQQEMEI